MTIEIPFDIGQEILVDGVKAEIKGLHCFVNRDGEVSNIRAYVGEELGHYKALLKNTRRKTDD